MKELSIEEKAKAYDEAFRIAQELYSSPNSSNIGKGYVCTIFPELHKSEDERIRKEIIAFLKENLETGRADETWSLSGLKRWIAWLEKQDEQKFTDKVKPKFHEGEWLCENEPNNYARFIQILETVNVQGKERYRISRDIHNDEDIIEFDFVEKYYHKFDIKDAKDGDVLQLGVVTAIFKEHISNVNCKCHCSVYNGEFEIPSQDDDDNSYGCHDATPATKEQRDTLIKAMYDAGYIFDFEKKELKKIEQKPAEWSEEDERMLESIISDFAAGHKSSIGQDKWLKSLKPQNHWKPTKEQMGALNYVVNLMASSESPKENDYYYNVFKDLRNQLKKLREE